MLQGSDAIVASIGLDEGLHADFGSGLYEGRPIGIPYDVVSKRTARERVRFGYADESDKVRYPIPRGVHIEGGRDADGDRHALLLDRSACRLYELFDLQGRPGAWTAGSGATWNLRSNRVRPAGWTSADAAGLPILPLLARHGEAKRGRIDHALRVTVRRSRRAYVYPGAALRLQRPRPVAAADGRAAAPEGGRGRLRAPAPGARDREGAEALRADRRRQRLGLVRLRRASPGWDNDQLRTLRGLTGRDFEVVDTRPLRR